jgi:hypothetical protein
MDATAQRLDCTSIYRKKEEISVLSSYEFGISIYINMPIIITTYIFLSSFRKPMLFLSQRTDTTINMKLRYKLDVAL